MRSPSVSYKENQTKTRNYPTWILKDTNLLQVPRFDSGCIFSQDPAISYIWSEKTLNADQRRAILKVRYPYIFWTNCIILTIKKFL